MTNDMVLLCYTPFFASTLVLLVAGLFTRPRSALVRYSMLFYAVLFCWQACEMLMYIVRGEEAIEHLFYLKQVFIALLPVAIYLTVAAFYRAEQVFSRKLLAGLCVVPAITVVLALVSPLHSLLIRSFTVLQTAPRMEFSYERGVFFYVFALYSQLMIIGVVLMIARFEHNLPRGYRNGSGLMILSLIFCWVGTLLETLRISPISLDITLLCCSVGGLLLYLATLSTGRTDALHIERKEFLDYLDESVFILNPAGKIVDVNDKAAAFLKDMGQSAEGASFEALLGELSAQGKISRHPAAEEGQDGEDIYIVDAQYPLVLRLSHSDVLGREGQREGSFAILSDATENRLLIERLRAMSGVDPLTGLSNQFQFRHELRRLDRPENLPLSVLVVEVQGLHQYNRQSGHERGDQALIQIAALLREACPEGSALARNSGSQFTALLPHYSSEAAHSLQADLRLAMTQAGVAGGELELVFYDATKTSPGENLSVLMPMPEAAKGALAAGLPQ